MDVRQLLPIGSVVLLKDGKKRVMIFGIRQSDAQNPEKEYDYVSVIYPEGNLGAQYQFMFNHEDIVRVDFRGFEDEERDAFLDQLDDYYRTHEQNGGDE